jgi:hypothetical protein
MFPKLNLGNCNELALLTLESLDFSLRVHPRDSNLRLNFVNML